MGKDTIEIANYRLTGDDFIATIIQRVNSSVNKLKGKFFPNGELQYMEGNRYKPVLGKDSLLLETFKLNYKGDSTYIEQKSGDRITERKIAGRVMVSYWPYVHMSVILANYAPGNVGDSIVGNQIVGDLPAAKFVVKRITDRKLLANSRVMGPFTLYLNDKATLGETLNLIEKSEKLHPAMKKAFSSLYGYSSDDAGIRHALIDRDRNVDFHESKFMLVTCSSFINFLKSRQG